MNTLVSTLAGLLEFTLACVTVLGVAFMVTVAMPKSPMRQLAIQVIGWAAALFCGLYVANPFDVLPEGLLGPVLGGADDTAALLLGIGGVIAAKRAGKDSKEISKQLTQALATRRQRRTQHNQN